MGCGCQKRKVDTPNDILPDEQCLMCAEKHFSTALALMRETGYEISNQRRIEAEMNLAAYHFLGLAPKLAARIRTEDIRSLIGAVAEITAHNELRMMAIGELVLAGWHTAVKDRNLAMLLRDLRHNLQQDGSEADRTKLISEIETKLNERG